MHGSRMNARVNKDEVAKETSVLRCKQTVFTNPMVWKVLASS